MEKATYFLAGVYNTIKRRRANPYYQLMVLIMINIAVHIYQVLLMLEIWGIEVPQMDIIPLVILVCVLVIAFQISIRAAFPYKKLKDIYVKDEDQKKIDIIQVKYFAATFIFLVFLLIRRSYLPGYN